MMTYGDIAVEKRQGGYGCASVVGTWDERPQGTNLRITLYFSSSFSDPSWSQEPCEKSLEHNQDGFKITILHTEKTSHVQCWDLDPDLVGIVTRMWLSREGVSLINVLTF